MKGQISFEQIISVIIFVAIVSYILFNVFNYIPVYLREMRNEELKSEAYQISELLINDPGDPPNWHTGVNINRIGLSNENQNKTNLISYDKLDKLNSICFPPDYVDYDTVNKSISTSHQFSISTSGIKCPILVDCRPKATIQKTGASPSLIRRIVAVDKPSAYCELKIQVW